MTDGNEMFFLGTGFSKAIHPTMPTMEELSEGVRHHAEAPRELGELFDEFGNDIELLLTFLSQPQPWISDQHTLRNRVLFWDVTRLIGEVIENSITNVTIGQIPEWLERLVTFGNESQSFVITVNQNTLVERAAAIGEIELEHIYATPLPDVRRVTVSGSDPISTFSLFKLHGSVNWYYFGAPSNEGEVIYLGRITPLNQPPGDHESESLFSAFDKFPLTVPPTSGKSAYFHHETVRANWREAARSLMNASSACCIGYSMPLTDLGIQFFMKSSAYELGPVPLYVVNNDPCVIARYETMLTGPYEIHDDYVGDDAIERLVDSLTS